MDYMVVKGKVSINYPPYALISDNQPFMHKSKLIWDIKNIGRKQNMKNQIFLIKLFSVLSAGRMFTYFINIIILFKFHTLPFAFF